MHTPSQNRIPTFVWVIAFLVGALFIGLAVTSGKAKAADKGGPKFDDIVPKTTTWTGCGVSANLGWLIGSMDSPSPITISAEGAKAGGGVYCDWQAGQHFVIGAFVNYDWMLGDLSTLGINTDLTYGARLGIPLNKTVMPYVGAARSHVDVDSIGRVDGWKALAGLEVRLATELPAYLGVEASRSFYENVAGSSVDINGTELTARLRIKLSK